MKLECIGRVRNESIESSMVQGLLKQSFVPVLKSIHLYLVLKEPRMTTLLSNL